MWFCRTDASHDSGRSRATSSMRRAAVRRGKRIATGPALDALRRGILQGDPGALLCVEFYADDPGELPNVLGDAEQDLARSAWRCRWRRALTLSDQARIWNLREAALGLSMAMKGDAKSLSFVE